MTRLAVKLLLPARTPFVHQKGAFRAADIVWVTVMLNCRMAAAGLPLAVEATVWRPSSARLRGLQYRSAAVATYLVKDCLGTAPARTAVANLLAVMATTFERPATSLDTDMLRFD